MAKDDYFVILYEIMKYLYTCLKQGVKPDIDKLTADYYNIPQSYWNYIVLNLVKDGYIQGVLTKDTKDGPVIVGTDYIEITPKGIQYYFDNSFLQKVKASLKDPDTLINFIK